MSPLESFNRGQGEPHARDGAGRWFLAVAVIFGILVVVISYYNPEVGVQEPVAPGKVLPWISDSGGPTTQNPLELVPGEQLHGIEFADTVMFEPIVLDSWIEDMVNLDGKTYLVCHSCVLRYDGTEKMTLVVLLPESLKIRAKRHFDRYWEVCGSGIPSDFVGLLECRESKWVFYPYDGADRGKMKSIFEECDYLVLIMEGDAPCSIAFNPKTGKFSDM